MLNDAKSSFKLLITFFEVLVGLYVTPGFRTDNLLEQTDLGKDRLRQASKVSVVHILRLTLCRKKAILHSGLNVYFLEMEINKISGKKK
jgi:hypothetical protein